MTQNKIEQLNKWSVNLINHNYTWLSSYGFAVAIGDLAFSVALWTKPS